jgi:hypothetical protein
VSESIIPCRLGEGVVLEGGGGGVLLPWGTPLAELQAMAGCEVAEYGGSTTYQWHDRACLGGLSCHVLASRAHGEPNPRAYHLYLDHFHSAALEVRGPRVSPPTAREEFRRLLDHLEGLLGPVRWSNPGYSLGLPSVFWEFPRLLVSFAVMGEAHYQIGLRHEPEGYKELRDEAAAIRAKQHTGARVEGLAW